MHAALRPYITSGVALVGASVIAVAPVIPTPTPPDVQIANPAVQIVERNVQLTAAQIENAVNTLVYNFIARPTVAGAQLLGRLLAPLVGDETAALLPIAALGLAGPLISGGGASGVALQDLVDSQGLEGLLISLINGPATLTDGFVNGGYGPDLAALVAPILFPTLDPELWPEILSGGLINEQDIQGVVIPVYPYFFPTNILLPGTIPTLQGLIDQLFGNEPTVATLAAAPSRPIEETVNQLVYGLTALTVRVVTLGAPVVARLLDVSNDQAAAFLTVGTLGLLGPLIGGGGGVGTGLQNLVDSDGFAGLLVNALGLVSLPIDGAVNGDLGPDLKALAIPALIALGEFPNVPSGYWPTTLAGGFINEGGIGLGGLTLPGTTPTLVGLVEQLFGSNQMLAARSSEDTLSAKIAVDPPGLDNLSADLQASAQVLAKALGSTPAAAEAIIKLALKHPGQLPAALGATVSGLLETVQVATAKPAADLVYGLPAPIGSSVAPGKGKPDGVIATGGSVVNGAIDDIQQVLAPKKKAAVLSLDNSSAKLSDEKGSTPKTNGPLFKHNPLAVAAHDIGNLVGADAGSKHSLGIGKTPVGDLVKRILGGDKKKDDDAPKAEEAAAEK